MIGVEAVNEGAPTHLSNLMFVSELLAKIKAV